MIMHFMDMYTLTAAQIVTSGHSTLQHTRGWMSFELTSYCGEIQDRASIPHQRAFDCEDSP